MGGPEEEIWIVSVAIAGMELPWYGTKDRAISLEI